MPFSTQRLSDLRKVLEEPELPKKSSPKAIDATGSDPYEVNEQTMYELRTRKEEQLLKTLTPQQRLERQLMQLQAEALM